MATIARVHSLDSQDAAAPIVSTCPHAAPACNVADLATSGRPRTRGSRGKRGRGVKRHTFSQSMRTHGAPDYVAKARAIEARIIDAIDRKAAILAR